MANESSLEKPVRLRFASHNVYSRAGAMATNSMRLYLHLTKAKVSNRYRSEVHKECYSIQLCMVRVNV